MTNLHKIDDFLNTKYFQITHFNFENSIIGMTRALLALSLLLTLLLNPTEILFPNNFVQYNDSFESINLFKIFSLQYGITISIVILLLVIIGFFPQITSILHFWVINSFINYSVVIDGGDMINNNITLLLIPICLFDRRINHWYYRENNYSKMNFFKYSSFLLIRIQLAYIYFQASISKFSVNEWLDGSALHYWFNNNMHGMNPAMSGVLNFILSNSLILTLLTWSVLGLEIFLCFSILSRRRSVLKFGFILGICFHFGIIIIFGLVSFFLSMSAALTFCFLIPIYNEREFIIINSNLYNRLFYNTKKT